MVAHVTDGPVQAIVVERAGVHADAVRAAALASALAWLATPDDPVWGPWFASGRVAKSVRRAKTHTKFDQAWAVAASHVTVGEARAAGFAPRRYDEFPAPVRQAQVQGVDFPRGPAAALPGDGPWPTVVADAGLAMSTGKTAAQVGHGLLEWLHAADPATRAAWAQAPGVRFHELAPDAFARLAPRAAVVIRDAGYTEIAPGSTTVLVLDSDVTCDTGTCECAARRPEPSAS